MAPTCSQTRNIVSVTFSVKKDKHNVPFLLTS